MAKSKRAQTIALFSLVVACLVLGMKLFAYWATDSTAILSDALESVVNVMAAIVALLVMRAVSFPADADHPYGHGKLEYFSAAFEGGLITSAGMAILREAYLNWTRGALPGSLDLGILIMAGASVVNLAFALFLRFETKKNPSEALSASQQHLLSDVLTTVGVIAGLFLFRFTDWGWIDPLVAALVGIHLLYSGLKIVFSASGGLVDQTDRASVEALCEAINKNRMPWVINVHDLRMIRSGNFHHIDCHVIVPEYWNVQEVHEQLHRFELKVIQSYPHDGEFACHVDPCMKRYCKSCRFEPCPIRVEPFQAQAPLGYPDITEKQHENH